MITKEEFESLTGFEKGYTVYALGNRDDEPNVPATYSPSFEERIEFERGQFQAMLHAQDSEE